MAATTCAERLAEARTALHALVTGASVASVSHGDQSVTYKQGNLDQLQAYIRQLEAECGGCDGRPRRRRPIGVVF